MHTKSSLQHKQNPAASERDCAALQVFKEMPARERSCSHILISGGMQLWTETVFKLAWDLPDTQPLFKQDGKRSQNVNVLAALGAAALFPGGFLLKDGHKRLEERK